MSVFFCTLENALQIVCPFLLIGIHSNHQKQFANLRRASSLPIRDPLKTLFELTRYSECQGRVLLHDPEIVRKKMALSECLVALRRLMY